MATLVELAPAVGAYLTDGFRLLQVVGGSGGELLLEDCYEPAAVAVPNRERWPVDDAVRLLKRVRRS